MSSPVRPCTHPLAPLFARIAVPALVLCAAISAPAATVGYWSFEDLPAGNPAIFVESSVNSAAVEGTGVSNQGGLQPYFGNALPGIQITDGLGGPLLNANNGTSLYFTNNGFEQDPPVVTSNSGGVISIPDSPLIRLESFTIEGFIRFEQFAEYTGIFSKNRADSGGSTWMMDTTNTGLLRARFDSQTLGTGGNGISGFNQSFTAQNALVNDGLWHHVALTYDGTTRTARLFLDYVDVGGGTVTNALVYDESALRFGGSGGGRAFDGDMDEVRLSDAVLTTDQFLRAVPEPGSAALLIAGALGLATRRRRK